MTEPTPHTERRRPAGGDRRVFALMAVVVALLAAVDGRRGPADQYGVPAVLAGIGLYQRILAPLLAVTAGARCRFEPTCSHYAEAVIADFGWASGGWLTARRLTRCGPWTAAGTVDPPPVPH